MLLHIRPRIFAPDFQVGLVDVRIEPFGLLLRNGQELIGRRPYANKGYTVACRMRGRKAVDGILVECRDAAPSYSTITRWALDAERILEHWVECEFTDNEFEATSEDMLLWAAWMFKPWANKKPDDAIPLRAEPCMEVLPRGLPVDREMEDLVQADGIIAKRRERFSLPTIETDRIVWNNVGRPYFRGPAIEDAFRV